MPDGPTSIPEYRRVRFEGRPVFFHGGGATAQIYLALSLFTVVVANVSCLVLIWFVCK